MNSLTNKLPDLGEHELKVIRKLTKSIVNQMMQDPILRIKEMAGEKRADEAMDMFVKLFALEEDLAKARQAELEAATDTVAAAKRKCSTPCSCGGISTYYKVEGC